MKWEKRRLEDVAEFCLGKMLDKEKNKGDFFPYLANLNVRWGYFDLENLREMRFEPNEMERYGLRWGDIVMCEGGEPGRCAIWKEHETPILIQKALHRIRPHSCLDNRFLYYSFLYKGRTGSFAQLFTGSTIKHLPRQNLAKVEVEFPDLTSQQRIADVLTAYDDLIENNRRRIQLLEQSARLLYKEWFVHLRFPGHERVQVVDGVPEGWERKLFSEVVDFKEGPGLRNFQYRSSGIPFLNIRTFNDDEIDLTKAKCIDESEVRSKYRHFLLAADDHVVSSSGTLGRLVTIRECHLPVMLNTSLIRMRPKGEMRKWFLKSYLKYGDFIDQAHSMATGAAQLNFGPSHLKVMTVLIPGRRLIGTFDEVVGGLYNQIKTLLDSNLRLSKARALLLPRLMNGELTL